MHSCSNSSCIAYALLVLLGFNVLFVGVAAALVVWGEVSKYVT